MLARRSLLAASVAVLAGCGRRGAAPSGPRIVSVTPNTTEALFALGAGASVVGRSKFCDFPDEARALPSIGGYTDPSLEAILGLRPTLVTGARGPIGMAMTQKLERAGIATYFPPTESLAEIDEMLRGLGERVARAKEADALVARVAKEREAVREAVAGRRRPTVVLLFGLAPMSGAGVKSFAGEMLAEAGGRNVVPGDFAYPLLDLERLIALDPDVVLDASMDTAEGGAAPHTFKVVRAVREGRFVRVSGSAVLRPGPRVAAGIRDLARALYPDLR